jgi:hypothetical protein
MQGKVKKNPNDPNKAKNALNKEIKKRMAGSEMLKDGSEGLGAKEDEGHNTALSTREKLLALARQQKKG